MRDNARSAVQCMLDVFFENFVTLKFLCVACVEGTAGMMIILCFRCVEGL